jgi:hypothetical protein
MHVGYWGGKESCEEYTGVEWRPKENESVHETTSISQEKKVPD